ncbi:xanthine dehydrogenase family protein molybdopterin-binding subunit [Roseateles sp. DAIF2]|uniref:xanthine dehydrogenase family protein molybdopterin-binding subunit n=1 Tax=Roseateles sp. DAIF2 TaxID=2714952 RepID=UPI0018A2C9E5|nr:molybdopterin cofactor-binding domain-containing protein [Roseateles sp. DAIF2]QPF76304.1 xanthine dehydrogenase family protein molybdopterin-binding subunit [Roseateles sp. DAIF2]
MMQRRDFMLRSGLVAGAWVLAGPLPAATPAQAAPSFSPWLRFEPDGRLIVLSNVVEMGQGAHLGVQRLAAEELDLPLARVVVEQAPVAARYASPAIKTYASYGSLGLELSFRDLRPACAAAREMLKQAAAARWGVDAPACRTAEGQVLHPDGSQRLDYAALLAEAARLSPPEKPALKPPADWRLLGKSAPRADLPAKVDGSARFGIDVRRPGMKVATVAHAPQFGAKLLALDEKPALKIAGVRRVLRLPGGTVAVVADSYWSARQGLQALKPRWADGPQAGLDAEPFRQRLLAAAQAGEGKPFEKHNDPRIDRPAVAQALAGAAQLLDISYDVPFLAHATLEPMNAIAEVSPDGARLWLSTQCAQDVQLGVARVLDLQPERVQVLPQLIGGGFGRRLEHGFAIEAALIAKAMKGVPVQLIWSRETDMRAGGYRPAAAARVRLALDAAGQPTALRVDAANPSLLEYTTLTNGTPSPEFDWSAGMGLMWQDYALGPMQLGWTRVDAGVPCGYWRSVGASQNVFFLECTIDRAAALAGIDPLAYRLRLLAERPQTRRLLEALAERAGWGRPLPAGHFRGMAMSAGNSARSAHVVEIALAGPGRFRLVRIHAAVDAGMVINPDAVEAQMMGGTLFGLSAALAGEITLADGRIQQGGFDSYPLVSLAQTPPLNVLVLGNGNRPRGVGEEGPASIGPAIANALFAATGRPVQRLPLTRAGWTLAD